MDPAVVLQLKEALQTARNFIMHENTNKMPYPKKKPVKSDSKSEKLTKSSKGKPTS